MLLIVALAGNASARGDEGRVLVWADRQGQMTPVIEIRKDYHCSLALSPDDRWMAYHTNESKDWEVIAQTFPTPGDKVKVSPA